MKSESGFSLAMACQPLIKELQSFHFQLIEMATFSQVI